MATPRNVTINPNGATTARRTGNTVLGDQHLERAPQTVVMSTANQTAVKAQAFSGGDPMMVLLAAIYTRTQIALEELSSLADAQKENNEKLDAVRNAENTVRRVLADGQIDEGDLQAIENAGTEAGIDLHSFTDQIRKELNGDTSYNAHGDDDRNRTLKARIDDLNASLNSLKDAIKGEGSARELDMQKVTQEVSTGMQAQSNISKRWSDVANAIVGNLRA
jgi:hypothetical protein